MSKKPDSIPVAIPFAEANFTYKAPPGMADCYDLPCFRGEKEAVSCWKLPWRDRFRMLWHGKVWFYCIGNSHPPIALLSVKPKFTEDAP